MIKVNVVNVVIINKGGARLFPAACLVKLRLKDELWLDRRTKVVGTTMIVPC